MSPDRSDLTLDLTRFSGSFLLQQTEERGTLSGRPVSQLTTDTSDLPKDWPFEDYATPPDQLTPTFDQLTPTLSSSEEIGKEKFSSTDDKMTRSSKELKRPRSETIKNKELLPKKRQKRDKVLTPLPTSTVVVRKLNIFAGFIGETEQSGVAQFCDLPIFQGLADGVLSKSMWHQFMSLQLQLCQRNEQDLFKVIAKCPAQQRIDFNTSILPQLREFRETLCSLVDKRYVGSNIELVGPFKRCSERLEKRCWGHSGLFAHYSHYLLLSKLGRELLESEREIPNFAKAWVDSISRLGGVVETMQNLIAEVNNEALDSDRDSFKEVFDNSIKDLISFYRLSYDFVVHSMLRDKEILMCHSVNLEDPMPSFLKKLRKILGWDLSRSRFQFQRDGESFFQCTVQVSEAKEGELETVFFIKLLSAQETVDKLRGSTVLWQGLPIIPNPKWVARVLYEAGGWLLSGSFFEVKQCRLGQYSIAIQLDSRAAEGNISSQFSLIFKGS